MQIQDFILRSPTELTDELIASVGVSETSPDVYRGQNMDFVGPRVFGGQVLAQALLSAAHTLLIDKPCHSLHGYFLRGGDIRLPTFYQVRRLRDGKSLSAREVVAVQPAKDGGQSVIFSMIASFALPESGLDYQPVIPSYPTPDTLKNEQQLKEDYLHDVPKHYQARYLKQRHFEIRPLIPRHPLYVSPTDPKQASWLRLYESRSLTMSVQQALLAMVSDYYLAGTAMMAHGITFMTKGLQVASIDHSMHFHRSFDLSEWLLYDMWSDTSSHAKGLSHGQFWQAGKLVATVQQEGLMRVLD